MMFIHLFISKNMKQKHVIQSWDQEEITRDIPGVGDDALKDLDDRGIIRYRCRGPCRRYSGRKVTPKGETELTAEERLLRAIFGEKASEVRDTSLKVPHGEYGIVVDAKGIYKRKWDTELSPGVNQAVRIYIAQKRKISVGDKMAGRHGNKGCCFPCTSSRRYAISA